MEMIILNSNAFLFDMVKSRKVKTITINCSHSGILPYSRKNNLKYTGRLYQSVICSDLFLTWSNLTRVVKKEI